MTIDSVCTYCGVGCEISAEVDGNKIEKIFSKEESKVSEGDLCIKGTDGYHFLYSEKRVSSALIRWRFIEENWKLFKDLDLDLTQPTIFQDNLFHKIPYSQAYKVVAKKIEQIIKNSSPKAFASIGGARTSCESGYMFQKFTREVLGSPNVDSCARVCHSPSLRGMRTTIGEGAATNPFSDIENSQFVILIGSNITEAHPITGDKLLKAKKDGKLEIATIDIRETQIFKNSKYGVVIPYEANLLILNMMTYVILKEGLENRDFINKRTKYFERFRDELLNDPYANPEFFREIAGYEYLADLLPKVAREYASKRSMILWGLGVTENFDGSYAVMALTHLALLTGNVGKSGAGLMPLRGQNNVQGNCDVGMLPYYNPDYQPPKEVGLMTPEVFDAILNDEVKAVWNMGEDLAHIHPNQNKVQEALNKLELLVVNEIMQNEITKFADVIFGVKSAYEKSGVYVNAERRLHLSQPLISSDLPDDWEVLQGVENEISSSWNYSTSKDVWNEVRVAVKNRYGGASYERLEENILSGLQWPVAENDTPILHLTEFRTKDGLGRFHYHQYKLRGQIKELLENGSYNNFYLSTGRTIAHYNNSAQTKATSRLERIHNRDTLLVSFSDRAFFKGVESVRLKTQFGESGDLPIKISKKIKKGTLFTTFHHVESRINFLFGDDSDELIKTALFKSLKVEVILN
jgi:formate dehydrogenase major subunit